MNCPECKKEIELVDTTYSNINTERCKNGEHTGDIYECEICNCLYIDNFLTHKLEIWNY